jgi:hypothetical protein
MLERWTRDFAHAARSLARAPGFTLVVVATLALPVGASTAIFSLVKVVLLEPLPFPNVDRLVHVAGTAPGTDRQSRWCTCQPCPGRPMNLRSTGTPKRPKIASSPVPAWRVG